MKFTQVISEFFKSEKATGILLIVCTVLSLLLANVFLPNTYLQFWHTNIGGESLEYWINDGLMAVFFLYVGLELKQEIVAGQLSNPTAALLPVAGALGGMIVPAGIYLLFNYGSNTQAGAGIPMATDIAFALGILSLLGKRIPASLKVFLTALAVLDDLGAILIIAFFYTATIYWLQLGISVGVFLVLLVLNRLRINHLILYIIGGIAMWYFMLHSGVHATITGVLLGFAVPYYKGEKSSPSLRLSHVLHAPVSFIILPLFAMANTAIIVSGGVGQLFHLPHSVGVLLGLVVGKPLGIIGFSFLAAYVGIGKLAPNLNWKHITGAGILGGIGFTISIFITLLAFEQTDVINQTKLAILLASFIAGVGGFLWLKLVTAKEVKLEGSK